MTLRRSRQGTNWVTKGLLDPLAFTGAYTRGRAQTELSDASSSTYALGLTYQLSLRRRGFRLPLGGLAGIVPGMTPGKSLRRADFSLVPTRVRFASGLNRNEANATAFLYPVARSDDRLLTPTVALNHLWRNSAGLTWQPIGMLTLNGDLTSTRDLRVYPDSTTIGRVAYNSRRFFLGIPVGVERDRNLSTAPGPHPDAHCLAAAPVPHQQQLHPLPDAQHPRSGAGGGRQRRVHSAEDHSTTRAPTRSASPWTWARRSGRHRATAAPWAGCSGGCGRWT